MIGARRWTWGSPICIFKSLWFSVPSTIVLFWIVLLSQLEWEPWKGRPFVVAPFLPRSSLSIFWPVTSMLFIMYMKLITGLEGPNHEIRSGWIVALRPALRPGLVAPAEWSGPAWGGGKKKGTPMCSFSPSTPSCRSCMLPCERKRVSLQGHPSQGLCDYGSLAGKG